MITPVLTVVKQTQENLYTLREEIVRQGGLLELEGILNVLANVQDEIERREKDEK